MTHRKNTRTGKPLSHDRSERERQLIEEKKKTGGAPGPGDVVPKTTSKSPPLQNAQVTTPEGKTFLGLGPEDVARVQQQQGIPAPQPTLLQQQQLREAQEEGLIPGEAPERVELDIDPKTGEGLPIVGSPVTALGLGIATFLEGTKLKSFVSKESDIEPLLQTPEGQREIMIAEIQEEQFSKSISATELVGVASEALGLNDLPFGIGELVNKFTKTPSEDVETLRQSISEMEGRASSMTDAASQGELGDPIKVLRNLRGMELEIGKLEAQLKFAIILSAELRSDPEQINLIELEILRARDTIFEGQQRAQEGAFITPTSESLFIQLQNLKGGR